MLEPIVVVVRCFNKHDVYIALTSDMKGYQIPTPKFTVVKKVNMAFKMYVCV